VRQKNAIFSANLRQLCAPHDNFSKLCRDMGFDRVQMRRYLDGDRWPQEQPLRTICDFFKVDARILDTPFDGIRAHLIRLPDLTWKQVNSNLWTARVMGQMYASTLTETDEGLIVVVSVAGVTIYNGPDLNEGIERARLDAEARIATELLGGKSC